MTEAAAVKRTKPATAAARECYHCGQPCLTRGITLGEKPFCCEGCRMVYELISSHGLCDYYAMDAHPGLQAVKAPRSEQYAILEDPAIAGKLCSFSSAEHAIVTLYIPGVHCSSCMWLLEHLHRLDSGISESRLNFGTKEVTVHFSPARISLRRVAELLAAVGYAPYVSLEDSDSKKTDAPGRLRTYRLGVAGFCFAFIMMMSFPEYFGGAALGERYTGIFRTLNLLLAVPVFFFCAGEFFSTAWKGLRSRTLNIDAPVALAILITFGRSVWEIATGSGAGYLDSMSGIVFFMLVGRVVQERTYRSISFHRNYKSYFPIGVTVLAADGPVVKTLADLQIGDRVELRSEEIIPADGVLLSGNARIDYSFVTGESEPLRISPGERLYAGGRQVGESLIMTVDKPVAGSYLTSLWNHNAFARNKSAEGAGRSSIHRLSRYFTFILFALAGITAVYWARTDPSRLANAVTAMLIVACPCALLLSATFTNGNLLRIFSNGGLFIRDASVIEQLGAVDYVVFDKTGTLTCGSTVTAHNSHMPGLAAQSLLRSVVYHSRHPYSIALSGHFSEAPLQEVTDWVEVPGQGISATVKGTPIRVGSAGFTGALDLSASVYASVAGEHFAFHVSPAMRPGLEATIRELLLDFSLALVSGDNDRQRKELRTLFGRHSTMRFRQQPGEKLSFVEMLQEEKHRVLMIGDGLNDAGALQQSDVGITLAEDVNNFTPACDAILDARYFSQLPAFLKLAQWGRRIILLSFTVSILYNICGLWFATQGKLSPMIAAILMPASTLSIVLLSTGLSAFVARRLRIGQNARHS